MFNITIPATKSSDFYIGREDFVSGIVLTVAQAQIYVFCRFTVDFFCNRQLDFPRKQVF